MTSAAFVSLPDDRAVRLDSLLAERGLDAVWFARPDNFAWLTGGSNVVDRTGDIGVAAARYDGQLTVVTNDIEGERLAVEELPEGVSVETVPWHEGSLAEAVRARTDGTAAADFPVEGLEPLDASPLRQPLSDRDVERYRALGRETAAALEAACRAATPEDTEQAVAGDLRGRLARRGIDAPVALVGGERRAPRFRHYTPIDVPLGDYALVSVTARRDGLYASCTRTVAFDTPDWLPERHRAATRVETTAIEATQRVGREGGTAGDVFGAIQNAYAALGYHGEWEHHHQGGAAGFAGREWIATPTSDAPVHLPMAYAWNPTVQGSKSEDTVLVRENEIEVLTRTGDWPETDVTSVGEGLTIARPGILSL
ncbi:M24 family metallopeptidase [Natronomonas sp. EA1]|uniref:M24 family metallopeptidase n=1 Tax=Natronomonas sp. EA1 TaxID=3421655 RepID=UPI003EBC1EFB